MKPIILYPVLMESWNNVHPFVNRFCSTLKKFKPQLEFQLAAIAVNREPTPECQQLFEGLEPMWLNYNGVAEDAGAWHQAAQSFGERFLICCTPTVYFYREDWLDKIVQARTEHGPGIYSTSASKERRIHLCGRCFGIDGHFLKTYPVNILNTFRQGVEIGYYSLVDHVCSNGGTARAVYGSGSYLRDGWFVHPNTFRKGDQSNLLVYDLHSDMFRDGDEAFKSRVTPMCSE